MAAINEAPVYDVVNPDPTFRDVFAAMRPKDWATIVGLTAAGIPLGFLSSRSPRALGPIMMHFAWVNFTGSLALGMGQTTYRLLGFSENKREVEKFGAFRKIEDMPYVRPQLIEQERTA